MAPATAPAVAQDPEKVTEETVSQGLAAVKQEAFGSSVTDASDIKLVVQPYLDIEAKSYTATETEKVLHVEITPKYDLLATAKDTRVDGTFSSWKEPDMLSLPPMAAVPQIFWASKAPSRAAAGFPQEQGSTVRSKYS